MSIIAKRIGEEFRDKVAEEVLEYLRGRYGERAICVGMSHNSSGSPIIRVDLGGDERAHLTITRARH
jgi:hypothetical protein